jgi:hypothetical protein
MKLSTTDVFPASYFAARQRFRDAARRLGWNVEVHPIDAKGPQGKEWRTAVIAGSIELIERAERGLLTK